MNDRRVGAALAVMAGVAIFLSQPPVAWWPLAFAAPALLVLAIGRRPADGWWLGLLTGLAAYLPMLAWVAIPAGVAAWIGLALIQGLWLAAFGWIVGPFVRGPGLALIAPLAWTGIDAWRNAVPLGGFGWGSLAYAHVEGSFLLPAARIVGQHGLTLFTVLIGTLIAMLLRAVLEGGWRATPDRRDVRVAGLALATTLLLSVGLTVEPPATEGSLDVLAVQGNDRFSGTGYDPVEDRRIATNMAALTRRAVFAGGPPDLTVWPESSLDRDPYSTEGEDLLPVLREAAETTGGGLLVGTNLDGPRPRTFVNASVLVDGEGEATETYVKRKLVPFGEYVPWRAVIGDLPPLRRVPSDAIPGPGPQSIPLHGTSVAAIICYETLFPELVRGNVLAGDAAVIVATTNDATFGRSAEPAQHLAQSRLRAVETGRWVVHAALSGSSAFVDPDGVVHDRTDLFQQAVIRRDVPLAVGVTPFLAVGDVVGLATRLAVVVLFLAAVAATFLRRSRPEQP